MGKILTGYKSTVINDIAYSNNHYYMFASDPIAITTASIPAVTSDDYSTLFFDSWQMLFGKRIKPADILPVIRNIQWQTGVVYDMYDNTKNMLNKNFYVVIPPAEVGGDYIIFKCISNNNGAVSTIQPVLADIKEYAVTKSDGYIWKYITSVSSAQYDKFATSAYIPVYPNTSIQSTALDNSGVDVVVIANSGSGYASYHSGVIQSVIDATLIQIEANASINNDFYVNNGIYIYNDNSPTSDLNIVSRYVSNSSGNWIYVTSELDVNIIDPGVTNYIISPRVVFKTNGDTPPLAYSVINTTSNSVSSINVIDTGSKITWANVHLESNSIYGSGANVYAIVAPPGGHGQDPSEELFTKGFCIAMTFANNENETIPTEITYNKIGILRNPYEINVATGDKTATPFTANTFSAVSQAQPLNSQTFTVGDTVTGVDTGTVATVAFSNSSILMLTGDKYFSNGEYIVSSDGMTTDQIIINSYGDIFTKDIRPIYVQNLSDITRSNTSSESYKLVVQI